LSNGAVATVSNNVVSNNIRDAVDVPCGPDPITQFQSVGIGVTLGTGRTVINNNEVSANNVGVYLR
jgi:hypothetical protein